MENVEGLRACAVLVCVIPDELIVKILRTKYFVEETA